MNVRSPAQIKLDLEVEEARRLSKDRSEFMEWLDMCLERAVECGMTKLTLLAHDRNWEQHFDHIVETLKPLGYIVTISTETWTNGWFKKTKYSQKNLTITWSL